MLGLKAEASSVRLQCGSSIHPLSSLHVSEVTAPLSSCFLQSYPPLVNSPITLSVEALCSKLSTGRSDSLNRRLGAIVCAITNSSKMPTLQLSNFFLLCTFLA